MKNLLRNINDNKTADELLWEYYFDTDLDDYQFFLRPLKSPELINKYWNYSFHLINNVGTWQLAERIIYHFRNKSVDIAFYKYCMLVPKYLQNDFWDCLDSKYSIGRQFSIENGIIIYIKPKRRYVRSHYTPKNIMEKSKKEKIRRVILPKVERSYSSIKSKSKRFKAKRVEDIGLVHQRMLNNNIKYIL